MDYPFAAEKRRDIILLGYCLIRIGTTLNGYQLKAKKRLRIGGSAVVP